MPSKQTGLVLSFLLIPWLAASQTFSENFSEFSARSSFIARYNYLFSASNIVTSQGINGNTMRTNPVTQNADTHFSTGWLHLTNGQTISFDHKITNASNSPVLNVVLLDLNLIPASTIFTYTYTGTSVVNSTATVNVDGWHRLRFIWSAPSNVNGRGMLDNVTSTIPSATNNRSYFLSDLEMSVDTDKSAYVAGETAQFSWVVYNRGPDTIHARPLTFQLPTGFYCNTVTVSNCTVDTTNRRISLANLPKNAVATLNIYSVARQTGLFTINGDSLASTFTLGVEIDHDPTDNFDEAVFTVSSPLPVDLAGFTAKRLAEGTLLEWQTEAELNTVVFEIERSTDGKSFERIGSVSAAGSSTTTISYHFTDHFPTDGVDIYYRLKTVFTDESPEYSVVRVVARSAFTAVDVFPNPADGTLNLRFGEEADWPEDWKIFDITGKLVRSGNVSNALEQIDVSSIPEGNYVLKTGSVAVRMSIK